MIKLIHNVSKKPLIISLIFVLAFVNPYVELLQFTNPIAYMLDHYALYAAGLIAGYKYLGALSGLYYRCYTHLVLAHPVVLRFSRILLAIPGLV
jgi:Protein of unknown function (DUF1404).